ncbi:OmpA family protein [Marinobacter litoralis]|uniref:OmpA family protein n=1 Tax=Marinobacter litoralis TaxID=187981 RepID=UPI0018EC3E10|nr:OmpA family protein [Marinobacter litoralis]MBJ6138923.1 OmpA family protein [Marinobacter litoralis]
MKAAIGLLLSSVIIAGCATNRGELDHPVFEASDEANAKGLATRYYIAADIDPSERETLDRHQRYQFFQRGCSLDFYTIGETTPKQRRWQLRESSLESGHLGTYRRFVSESTFDQGMSDIPGPLQDDLTWFSREIMRSPLMPYVLVIGHTNSDGSQSFNQALSERRSESVQAALVAQGFPENRIQHFGVGETSPLMVLDSVRSRYLNRRVELVTFIPTAPNKREPPCKPSWDLSISGTDEELQQ